MDEPTLLGILKAEEEDAVGYYNSEIADEQERALDYYYGRPFGDEVAGRSQVVSQDIAEIVDSQVPELVELFAGAENAITFVPVSEEDEAFAQLATDYVRHIFWVDNHGFMILHDLVKDGYLQKLGVAKVWWDGSNEQRRYTYDGLSTPAIVTLATDQSVTILAYDEHDILPDEAHPDGKSYDVTLVRSADRGRVRVDNVPPEEFLVAKRVRDINSGMQHCRYVAHRRPNVPVSELLELGIERTVIDGLVSDDSETDFDNRRRQRYDDEGYNDADTSANRDPAMRTVTLIEEYLAVDFDGDDVAETRRCLRVNDTILSNDEVDDHPFAAFSPFKMPHKLYGQSTFDKIQSLQRIKSVLWRGMLDAQYLANNPRTAVDVAGDGVNLDDLLTSRPGGVVRTKGPPGEKIMPLPTANQSADSFGLLKYADQEKEARTGVVRMNPQLDGGHLHETASGMTKILDRMQGRVRLVARILAEGALTRLYRLSLKSIVHHQNAPRMLRMQNQWVWFDPRSWHSELDVRIHVGVGAENRAVKREQFDAVFARQLQLYQILGPGNGIIGPKELAHALEKLIQSIGVGEAANFVAHPEAAPAAPTLPEPKPDPRIELAEAELLHRATRDQRKFALEAAKLAERSALDRTKHQDELALKLEALRLKYGLDRLDAGGEDVSLEPVARDMETVRGVE